MIFPKIVRFGLRPTFWPSGVIEFPCGSRFEWYFQKTSHPESRRFVSAPPDDRSFCPPTVVCPPTVILLLRAGRSGLREDVISVCSAPRKSVGFSACERFLRFFRPDRLRSLRPLRDLRSLRRSGRKNLRKRSLRSGNRRIFATLHSLRSHPPSALDLPALRTKTTVSGQNDGFRPK